MNIETYLTLLSPELVLLVGACVVLFAGTGKSARSASVAPTVTVFVIVLALSATLRFRDFGSGEIIPGLLLTELTFYVRLIALSVGLLLILVNWYQPAAGERGEYMAMVLFSLLGVLLTASANDLVVLFFAIELVSIPTYILIALSRTDSRASEATVKYFFLGALAAAVLAYGLSLLYGVAGTTTIHAVRDGVIESNLAFGSEMAPLAVIGLLLVFGGLAFKVAAVPFHVYAPDVYEGAASPVTGLLGFVPKLAGFVALVKIFGALNWELPSALMWMVWIVAAVTMTAGNTLALLQKNAKRMLAYSSIAHTGYMLIALLVGPLAGKGPMHDGVAALMFYIAVYGVMNLGAFALLTVFQKDGRPVETLDDLAGLAAKAPLAGLALAICVFSLMGFPPTAGFLGKLYIFSSAFSLDAAHPFHGPLIILAVIGVINSAIAAAYYLRIVSVAYTGGDGEGLVRSGGEPAAWGLGLCSILVLVLFVWPGGLVDQARHTPVVLSGPVVASKGSLTSASHHEEKSLASVAFSSQPTLTEHVPADSPPGARVD